MFAKRRRIWVLAAESTRARVTAWDHDTSRLEPVEGLDWSEPHPHGRDINSERPGRVRESFGSARHAIEPHTDPVELFERRFATRIATALDERLQRNEFDRIIVVAAPATLGRLRHSFSAKLSKVVDSEVGKDLQHLSNHDLAARLKELDRL